MVPAGLILPPASKRYPRNPGSSARPFSPLATRTSRGVMRKPFSASAIAGSKSAFHASLP
jgi:hypothetical protein